MTRPGTRTTCSEGAHGVFVCAVAGARAPPATSRGAAGELIQKDIQWAIQFCHLARGASEWVGMPKSVL